MTLTEPEFQDKFVAFVDILGFSARVEAAEENDETSLSHIISLCTKLAQPAHVQAISESGPVVCPRSRYVSRDLSYEVTQVSDCVVISTEVSPAGIINLLHHASASVFSLLRDGIMVRGCVSRGNIFHNGTQFIGTGYQTVVEKEKKVSAFRVPLDEYSTPFIEVDPIVVDYIKEETDECVRQVFRQLSKEDENGITVIYPFRRLSNILGGNISDVENFGKDVNIVKGWIETFIANLDSNAPQADVEARRKAKYYRMFLLEELEACRSLEREISILQEPFIRDMHERDIP